MTDDWFKADTWPLEAAITWLLYGDKRLAGIAAALAFERRRYPAGPLPTLGRLVLANERSAARFEVRAGSLYRSNEREGWSPESRATHPFRRATHPLTRVVKQAAALMVGHPATGCRGGTQRISIPPKLWKSAKLIDDHLLGLILLAPNQDGAWRYIDVPAALFRVFPSKRGRRPLGLSTKPPGSSIKTSERLQTKERRQKIKRGKQPARESRGRPKGSKNVAH